VSESAEKMKKKEERRCSMKGHRWLLLIGPQYDGKHIHQCAVCKAYKKRGEEGAGIGERETNPG
jgi:hypothetical protein